MATILLKSTFELAAIILLLYGFTREKELIEIEQLLGRLIRIRFKLFMRKLKTK